MPKICKDFTYEGKKLSDFNLIMVDFDESTDIVLAMNREIIRGESTKYRSIQNHLGTKYSENLEFEIHLMKDPCVVDTEYHKYELSREELQEISRWLTSTHYPSRLEFEYETSQIQDIHYCGLFSKIESYANGDVLMGLRLTFTNDSSFGYSNETVNTETLNSGQKSITINNNSDLLQDYLYPQISLKSTAKEQVYICNLSDCEILKESTLTLGANNTATFDTLVDKVDEYALSKGYTSHYTYPSGSNFIESIANHTALQVRFTSVWGDELKCMAFYNETTGDYKIIQGGFMFLELKAHLPVVIDCQLHTITDEIGRLIHFYDMGVSDVDYMYWTRFISGDNNIVCYGNNSEITFKRTELRKVGAV